MASSGRTGGQLPTSVTDLPKISERDQLLDLKCDKGKYGFNKAAGDRGTKVEIERPTPPQKDSGNTLIIAFFLMLFFQLGNRIFNRLSTFPMHNYPVFTNMMSCAIYIPICFAYIIPIVAYTKNISQEQQEIPKYKFAVMGAYDSLAGIMQTFATNYISSSSTIVLVQQSAIPISMAISKVALKAEYTFYQYLGAAVVLFGIFIVLIPQLSSHGSSSGEDDSTFQLFWIAVMVFSCIPMCLSSVYKEKALGETEIDVVYLNGWVAVYQFLFSLPLCIPSSAVIGMGLTEIMPNLWGGAKCWVGINTVMAGNAKGLPADDCSAAPLFYNFYLAFNVVFNILIVVILKHGSANIMWMASTVIVSYSTNSPSVELSSCRFLSTAQQFTDCLCLILSLLCSLLSTHLFSPPSCVPHHTPHTTHHTPHTTHHTPHTTHHTPHTTHHTPRTTHHAPRTTHHRCH